MCGRFVITNPVAKTKGLVKTAIKVEDNENYNAHPTQNLPVIKKYTNPYGFDGTKGEQLGTPKKEKPKKILSEQDKRELSKGGLSPLNMWGNAKIQFGRKKNK